MKAVVQRVKNASVEIDGKIYSSINEDGYITGVFGSLRPIVTLPYSSIDFSVGDGQENSAWGIK